LADHPSLARSGSAAAGCVDSKGPISATKFEFRLSKMTPIETFSLERFRSLSKNAHFGMWLNLWHGGRQGWTPTRTRKERGVRSIWSLHRGTPQNLN